MTEVQIRKSEPVDRALKRLKTRLEMDGILEEVRRLRQQLEWLTNEFEAFRKQFQ